MNFQRFSKTLEVEEILKSGFEKKIWVRLIFRQTENSSWTTRKRYGKRH